MLKVPQLSKHKIVRAALKSAAALACAFPSTGYACIGEIEHAILPSVPNFVPAEALVLKVQLDELSQFSPDHDGAVLKVLKVIKGIYPGKTIEVLIKPVTSCEAVGIVGRPGFVVVERYDSSWAPLRYFVRGRRTFWPHIRERP